MHVDRGIIRQTALGLRHIELSLLRVAHFHVVQVGKRNERASAHAARDHDLADLADDIVRVKIREPAPLALQNFLARETQERAQGIGTGRFSAHCFQPRARGAELRIVKLHIVAVKPRLHAEDERVRPSFFGIGDDIGRQFFSGLAFYLRKRLDVLALHGKSDARAAHGDVDDLSEVLQA